MTKRPRFGRVAPSLSVSDLDRAILFWKNLGFEVTFTNGNPICFAILKQDDAEIHLCREEARVGKGHCHILVGNLEDFAANFEGTLIQNLQTQSWGMRDMVIADPDGNSIELAERI